MTHFVKVAYTISKPIDVVFDAIVNKDKIVNFFVSDASGDLEAGKTIIWTWADYNAEGPVHVKKIIENELIEFEWDVQGKMVLVSMVFKEKEGNKTHLTIMENGFELTDKDVKRMLDQTQGWTDFICCLKGYLYAGINLRK